MLGHLDEVKPGLLVLDSVQSFTAPGTDGVAGGVTQVRAVTAALVAVAKERGIATVLVGHVTKDGQVAGPGCWSTWWTWCSSSKGTSSPRSAWSAG